MPWNFPLWQVVRFAAPALMAGNVGLLKHASNVPQTALYLGELFHRAGFPEGCFQTLLVGSGAVEAVLRDPRVAAATLTGSEARRPGGRRGRGRRGQEDRARTRRQRPVRRDAVGRHRPRPPRSPSPPACRTTASPASPPSASSSTPTSTTRSPSGSSAGMRALTVGDPMDDGRPTSARWPPSRAATDLEELVDDALDAGRAGAVRRPAPHGAAGGWYYEPTVLTGDHRRDAHPPRGGVRPGRHALPGRRTWTRRSSWPTTRRSASVPTCGRATRTSSERFVRDLEAGGVFFNGMTASHPALPFGGVKRSGYGRELSGHGIREFCNTTTVWRA